MATEPILEAQGLVLDHQWKKGTDPNDPNVYLTAPKGTDPRAITELEKHAAIRDGISMDHHQKSDRVEISMKEEDYKRLRDEMSDARLQARINESFANPNDPAAIKNLEHRSAVEGIVNSEWHVEADGKAHLVVPKKGLSMDIEDNLAKTVERGKSAGQDELGEVSFKPDGSGSVEITMDSRTLERLKIEVKEEHGRLVKEALSRPSASAAVPMEVDGDVNHGLSGAAPKELNKSRVV